jgi:hypothetical protein
MIYKKDSFLNYNFVSFLMRNGYRPRIINMDNLDKIAVEENGSKTFPEHYSKSSGPVDWDASVGERYNEDGHVGDVEGLRHYLSKVDDVGYIIDESLE